MSRWGGYVRHPRVDGTEEVVDFSRSCAIEALLKVGVALLTGGLIAGIPAPPELLSLLFEHEIAEPIETKKMQSAKLLLIESPVHSKLALVWH